MSENEAVQNSSGRATPILMQSRIDELDWSATPLGANLDWPTALTTAANIALGSRQPMFLAWGAELTFLYNDAYAEILGNKHPAALGQPFQQVWSEIWEILSHSSTVP